MNPDNMTPEQIKNTQDFLFQGLPQFHLAVTKPDDARYLCEAILLRISSGNVKQAHETLQILMSLSLICDPGIVMKVFFDEGKSRGFDFPEFVKPIFEHVLKHILERNKILQATQRNTDQ